MTTPASTKELTLPRDPTHYGERRSTALTDLVDAVGTAHARAAADARIICLVPSITELVCDLGLGGQLVGRTGFCIHPRESVRRIPKLGGTKGIELGRARALRPTHAIVNIEENTKEDATALAEFVPHTIVTYPRAPRDNLGCIA